jgi:hypothetical protein
MHCNFVRLRQTLRVTLAIAAGIGDMSWSLEDKVRTEFRWEETSKVAQGEETMVGENICRYRCRFKK